jgi:diguanylate cyclase (GGDEF)-like protein
MQTPAPELLLAVGTQASLRRAWSTRDPVLQEAGRLGEIFLARARIAVGALFIAIGLLTNASTRIALVTIFTGAVPVACGLLFLKLAKQGRWTRSLGYVTTFLDISVVTAVILLLTDGSGAVSWANQRNTFAAYLMVLTSTALRYDVRISVFATLCVCLQYGILCGIAMVLARGAATKAGQLPLGDLDAHVHMVRLALYAITGALATMAVSRMQGLLKLSATDSLTGLLNRRYLDLALEEQIEKARACGRTLAVAILDIDHFKRFNDRYGHEVGDVALRTVASVLRRSVRVTDVVARQGGEEFAVVAPGIDARMALERADCLRREIARTRLRVPGHRADAEPIEPLTVSIGLALWPSDARDPAALLRAADARLYAAKAAGRNRTHGPPPPERRPASVAGASAPAAAERRALEGAG